MTNRLNRFRGSTMTRKLKELQTFIDVVKVGEEELAVWTDGSSEVVVLSGNVPESLTEDLIRVTAKVFGIEAKNTLGKILPSTYIGHYRARDSGYYIERRTAS